jgi:hypothetical protein
MAAQFLFTVVLAHGRYEPPGGLLLPELPRKRRPLSLGSERRKRVSPLWREVGIPEVPGAAVSRFQAVVRLRAVEGWELGAKLHKGART